MIDDIFEVSQEMRQHCQWAVGKVLVCEMRAALVRLQQKLHPSPYRFSVRPYRPPVKPLMYPVDDLVYFVLDPVMDLIKIGYSGDFNSRFRRLQLDWTEDLIFLGAIRGYRRPEEKILHEVFQRYQCKMTTHREWFFAEKPLYFFINHFCEIKPDSN